MGYYADLARKAEKESNWWNAWRCWMNEGGDYEKEQANVCKTIAEAVDLGDKYRALVGDAQERWENHEINNRELRDIQTAASMKVYGHP